MPLPKPPRQVMPVGHSAFDRQTWPEFPAPQVDWQTARSGIPIPPGVTQQISGAVQFACPMHV
jgi:hypothetical protein